MEIKGEYLIINGLQQLNIYNNSGEVINIGSRAFYEFSGLNTIHVKAIIPPNALFLTFSDDKYASCLLFAPSGSKEYNENQSPWSKFNKIKEFSSEAGSSLKQTDSATEIQIFPNPEKDIYL